MLSDNSYMSFGGYWYLDPGQSGYESDDPSVGFVVQSSRLRWRSTGFDRGELQQRDLGDGMDLGDIASQMATDGSEPPSEEKCKRPPSLVSDWFREHGSVDVAFNVGTGLIGISTQASISESGVSWAIGGGWGIGFGFAVTPSLSFGDNTGWGIQTSVSGGTGQLGGSATGGLSQGGPFLNLGGGWGVGGGVGVTVGYSDEIIEWCP